MGEFKAEVTEARQRGYRTSKRVARVANLSSVENVKQSLNEKKLEQKRRLVYSPWRLLVQFYVLNLSYRGYCITFLLNDALK
ncbi:hypothetical protein E4T56_gene9922 [Termitomyces sp. T112]|nr:hypothetical protein E4T56_gene9922 [Termitomyces sp. T112]